MGAGGRFPHGIPRSARDSVASDLGEQRRRCARVLSPLAISLSELGAEHSGAGYAFGNHPRERDGNTPCFVQTTARNKIERLRPSGEDAT